MRTRMTCGMAPSTDSSRAHSSGMSAMPIRRAASAGNMACRSAVAVNRMLTRSSWARALRAIISWSSSAVADRISSLVSSATVMAPRTPLTRMGRSLSQPDSAIELGDLALGEPAVAARGQAVEAQRAELRAHQPDDRKAGGGKHPPHDVVAALVHHDLQEAPGVPAPAHIGDVHLVGSSDLAPAD